jgi:threonylcarbamoyladenosine tRNA methylthiotransferase CDKAL1
MNQIRVAVKSFGCSANLSDGEVLAGCLKAAGFILVESIQAADIIVYNCCAVKGPTENRMIAAVKRAPKKKKVVVAGCLSLINFDRLNRETRFDGVVGPAFGSGIVDVVKRVCAGEKIVALQNATKTQPCLTLPRARSNPLVSVVPINYGCLGSCAYCCVRFARGKLRSYSVAEVAERFMADLAAGTREFWITSQDTACYGRDIGTNLAKLLKSVCSLQGDFRVRVGMMTPSHVVDMLDDLVEAYKSEKVFKFLHLPVQSGDDTVLKRMNRFYTVQQFEDIVEAFRAEFPDLTLATDVICGFPGETREALESTLQLIGEVKPDVVNISKFFARPNTAAAKMTDGLVDQAEIKRRSAKTASLTKKISLARNQRWLNWQGEILVDERGKVAGTWIGRNFAYKPVVVKKASNLLGKALQAKVVAACQTYLVGEVCG